MKEFKGTKGECVAEFVVNEANAKIIVAAPELLEALQEVLKQLKLVENPMLTEHHNAILKAEKAIEKALK